MLIASLELFQQYFFVPFIKQVPRPNAPPAYNYQNIQMSSMQPGPLQYNPNQPLLGTNVQAPSTHNAQPAYNNPCSGLVSFVINMPSYFFGGPNGAPLSAINVTVQPVPSNQQVPASEPARNVEQLQTAIADGAQQNLPRSTWEQVKLSSQYFFVASFHLDNVLVS